MEILHILSTAFKVFIHLSIPVPLLRLPSLHLEYCFIIIYLLICFPINCEHCEGRDHLIHLVPQCPAQFLVHSGHFLSMCSMTQE